MINLKELGNDKIFLGTTFVKKIFLGSQTVFPCSSPLSLSLFHALIPKTATEIKFLFASDNPGLSDYTFVGYVDSKDTIEVYQNQTSYILICPLFDTITAPASCYAFFENYQKLTTLIMTSLNTANVTDMGYMFHSCSALTSLDLSSFNTENVTNMYSMFFYCSALTSLDLSSFNTKNVTNMAYMFCQCSRLITIISNSFVRNKGLSSDFMFSSCVALVGGNGTTYTSSRITANYARVDGESGLPGYFTAPATF